MTAHKDNDGPSLAGFDPWALLDATGFAVYRLRELELAEFDLTIEQAAVLGLLKALRRGMTAGQIKDLTLRQQNSISVLTKRMVALGLVTKERVPGNRDLTILITQEGRRLLRKIPVTCLREAFSELTEDGRRGLAQSLLSLYRNARGLLVPDKPPFMQYVTRGLPTVPPAEESSSDSTPSDYILWSRLNSTRFAISRLRELELAPLGLSVEQASVLRILMDAAGSLTFKDIEDASLRQHHSVSVLVNRMTKTGLVRMKAEPGTRRYRIFITSKGKNLLAGVKTMATDMVFASLTGTEKRELRASLRSVYGRARDLLGASKLEQGVPSIAGDG
jgi:DNA-binding MarR family transcriptional regulator